MSGNVNAKKELLDVKNQLGKALSASDDGLVKDILQKCMAIKPTYEMLKDTKCGVFVNNVRKNDDISTATKNLARDVVEKWKKDVAQDSNGNANSTTNTKTGLAIAPPRRNSSMSAGTPQSWNDKPSPQSASTPTTPAADAPGPRTLESDNLHPKLIGVRMRDGFISLLYKSMATGSTSDGQGILDVVRGIEYGVFDFNKGKDKEYQAHMRSVITALKTNRELAQELIDNQRSAESVAQMSSEDMMSKEKREAKEKALKEALNEAQAANTESAETDIFKCGKCGKRRTTYTQKQTRSADEPMTTFVVCKECGNRWKFS
ncbi:transcription factor S-II-domain-containing protein [Cladochytrium replicatum]|nr:transcription factor S-II-domain-containing protein [Cladochytrium replicatum]